MPSPNELVVIGIGLATPLGIGWQQTTTAVRAGVSAFREVSWDGAFFPPTRMATLPRKVLPDFPGQGEEAASEVESRLVRMAALALAALGGNRTGRSMPVLIGLPHEQELSGYRPSEVVDLLARAAPGWGEPAATRALCRGRASGLLAMCEAGRMIQSGAADMVLAGGVDTHRDMARVEALDEAGRLNTDQNLDGFVPGEGAGFVLLASVGAARDMGVSPVCRLAGVATGFEAGHLGSSEPYRGEGLAVTWQALLDAAPRRVAGTVFSSMNGEHHWAKELGTACIRCKEHLADELAVEHPADCYGDLGAATGPALMAQAAWNLGRGHCSGPALAYCSSDLGDRAAVLVEAP